MGGKGEEGAGIRCRALAVGVVGWTRGEEGPAGSVRGEAGGSEGGGSWACGQPWTLLPANEAVLAGCTPRRLDRGLGRSASSSSLASLLASTLPLSMAALALAWDGR